MGRREGYDLKPRSGTAKKHSSGIRPILKRNGAPRQGGIGREKDYHSTIYKGSQIPVRASPTVLNMSMVLWEKSQRAAR